MPSDNGFRFNDNQDLAPQRPKPAEKNPKHSIRHAQSGARVLSLEDAQLLAQRKDLKTEVVTGTEKCAEICEEAREKSNHSAGFISR
jgi:hypothetical protein